MGSKIRFVLNINSGTVSSRTSETDKNPIIFRMIDDATASAIVKKEVSVDVVIEAINRKEYGKPGFSWKEYEAKRRAAEDLLNVSQREMIPVTDDPKLKSEERQINPDDVVTLADIAKPTEKATPEDAGGKEKSGKAKTAVKQPAEGEGADALSGLN